MGNNIKKELYCLTNVSELRTLGTTNFFRFLTEPKSNSKGLVQIVSTNPMEEVGQTVKLIRHYLKFELYNGDKVSTVPTITNLLNNLKVSEIKEDIEILKELSRDYKIIKAETQITDYRNNTNPNFYKVSYVTSEEVNLTENRVSYKDVDEKYKQCDQKELEIPIFQTSKKTEKLLQKYKNSNGKIRGF